MRLRSLSPPPPPPPPPVPSVPSAGWSGRYPHLDALRVSAMAHRRSMEDAGSLSSSATVAAADGGGESFAFGQHQGLSAAEAASRAAWATAPPSSSFARLSTAASPPQPPSQSPPSAAAPATAVASSPHHPASSSALPRASYPPDDPRGARAMLREAVAGLEAARARRGFYDSLLRDGPPQVNERYTARLQALKKHARAAISLTPRTRRPSNALADLVGMLVAAVAMAFATFTAYLAQRQGPQFGVVYVMILVGGYVVKGKSNTFFFYREKENA